MNTLPCQCRGHRLERANKLCAALDRAAGPGRVLAGLAKVLIYSKANDGAVEESCRVLALKAD